MTPWGCSMTGRKGERTTAMNEWEFPFVVRLPVPEAIGFGLTLEKIAAWHGERGLTERRGRAARIGDQCTHLTDASD